MKRFIGSPQRIPWYLRPALWIARRMTGKEPVPGQILAHFPKAALGVGIFELAAAHAPKDLEGRVLAVARIVSSVVGGCPFCIDMNAATWRTAGLGADELPGVLSLSYPSSLSVRERLAGEYAEALSKTPVVVNERMQASLRDAFSEHEIVVLAVTIAQVNFWTRFNQGVGVGSAGFFDESVCALPRSR